MCFLRRTIILAFTILLICTMLASCSRSVNNDTAVLIAKSGDDLSWQQAASDILTLSNDKTFFEFDTKTTHFTVTNKVSGKKYYSVPQDIVASSEDTQYRLASEISVRYYDNYSKVYDMYSTKDCVSSGGVSVKYSGNKIRVYYSFGASSSNLFVPKVLTKDDYENKIVPTLTGGNARHIGLYYTLYSNSDKADDFADKLKQYPILAKQDLYILNENLSTAEKGETDEIMTKVGYTKEVYAAVLKKLSIIESAGTEAGFVVPLEYALEADGFTATVLTDKVKETINTFKLQQIDLLEYFACTGEETDGQYLVPDGSGALIKMNNDVQGNYTQAFYGDDYSILTQKASQLSQPAALPIFGIIEKNNGIFAMVNGAASVATLTVRTKGFAYPQNTAYISYAYRTKDVVVSSDMASGESTKGEYNLYCTSPLAQLPSVRYALLTGESASYSGMANYYRASLLKEKTLVANKGNDAVYLDFNCLITSKKTVLGFSYDEKITLSTLKDISLFVKGLYDKGVKHIVVRLNGYGSSGLSHGVNDTFSLDKSVGTIDEMKALAALVKAHGGALYLNADFQFVYKTTLFDGFSERRDSAYYLDRSLVNRGDYSIVTREYSNASHAGFLLSPVRYSDFAVAFLKSLQSKTGSETSIGLSYNSVGQTLGGDYNIKKNMNRTISQQYVDNALKAVVGDTHSLMTDGGNGYILPYAAHILNLPLNASSFDAETQSVPFYQMVVHGCVSYCGTAYNQSVEPKEYLLRMVESGANPYFALINRADDLLVGTEYNAKLYSLNSDEWRVALLSIYNKLGTYYSSIANTYMVKHEQLFPSVFCTTYGNGVRAIVNYSKQVAVVDGVTVGANDYYIFSK